MEYYSYLYGENLAYSKEYLPFQLLPIFTKTNIRYMCACNTKDANITTTKGGNLKTAHKEYTMQYTQSVPRSTIKHDYTYRNTHH